MTPLPKGLKVVDSGLILDGGNVVLQDRTAIVTNGVSYWDQNDQVAITGKNWYVHAERREASKDASKDKYAADAPAFLHHQNRLSQFGGLDGGAAAGGTGADNDEIMSTQHGPIRQG